MLKQFVGKAVVVVVFVVGIFCLDKKEQWCQTPPSTQGHCYPQTYIKHLGFTERKKKDISNTLWILIHDDNFLSMWRFRSFPVDRFFTEPNSQSLTLKIIIKKKWYWSEEPLRCFSLSVDTCRADSRLLVSINKVFLAPFILPWRQLKKEKRKNSSGIKSVLVCVQETATFQLFGVWCHANCSLDSFIGLQMKTWLISSQSEPSDNNNDNILTIIKTSCCLHFLRLFLDSSVQKRWRMQTFLACAAAISHTTRGLWVLRVYLTHR